MFAALALAIGKKTGWDLYNYHWYNPYALLNDRFGFDVAVAHHATYYNPLADLPLYWLGMYGPAWLGGGFLGLMAGATVAAIGVLGYQTLSIDDAKQRTLFAASLALTGALGAGAFQEIGDPANDIPSALGIFAALIICVRQLQRAANGHESREAVALVVAGSAAGIAVALKLTIAVYAVGIGGALLFAGGSFVQRVKRAGLFAAGGAMGLSLAGGFWMLKMWQYSGNPFFPYFNEFFHSHLLVATSYRDRNFSPHTLRDAVLFPLYFTLESRNVSESIFRDAHVLIVYLLLPVTLLVRWAARRIDHAQLSVATRFIFIFTAISYVAWLALFDIYRYLIPLEMVAPLLIALALAAWPLRPSIRLFATAAILCVAQLVVRVDLSDRQSWQGPYVEVSIPQLAEPDRTMIVMTGHAPMAYVIPFFPKEIPFVRIDSWLVQGSDRTTGLALEMRRRVREHSGPMLALFEKKELEQATLAAENYGLRLLGGSRQEQGHCDAVRSNINEALMLCDVVRGPPASE